VLAVKGLVAILIVSVRLLQWIDRPRSQCQRLVDGIQRIYDGGWDPSAQRDDSKSEQVRQCMDLRHCLHWLHAVAPTHLFSGP
jgi:hypothetical protein